MAESAQPPRRRRVPSPSFAEFVALISFTMGLMSLSIDNLLPAFGAIRASFDVADANEMQLIISAYMVAFALMQIVYGPLSDVIGRRPAMMIGLAVYGVGTVVAIFAPSFGLLLAGRAVQGMGAAAIRVLVVAIVRDRYSGREMARVMSLILMVFIIVPVFAPAIGSLFLWLGGWRLIFISMLALAAIVATGFVLRMPETLHPEYRFPFSMRRILDGAVQTVKSARRSAMPAPRGSRWAFCSAISTRAADLRDGRSMGWGHGFALVFGAIATCWARRPSPIPDSSAGSACGGSPISGSADSSVTATLLCAGGAFAGRPPLACLGRCWRRPCLLSL